MKRAAFLGAVKCGFEGERQLWSGTLFRFTPEVAGEEYGVMLRVGSDEPGAMVAPGFILLPAQVEEGKTTLSRLDDLLETQGIGTDDSDVALARIGYERVQV